MRLPRRTGSGSLRIELLYFEGCPGAAEALRAIARVVAEDELVADVMPVEVTVGDHPGFSGSPTVLVDGRDPFPASRTDGLSCRLYSTPEGLKGSPTDAMLRTAVGERNRAQAEAL